MRMFSRLIQPLTMVFLLAFAGAGCTAKMIASHHLKRAERYFDAGQYELAEIEYKNVLRNAPQNSEAWDRLGIIYFDEGRGSEALPILLHAEQLDPANLDSRLKLGDVFLGFGKLKEARHEADFVLSQNPHNGEALLLLANCAATPDEFNADRLRFQQMSRDNDSASVELALGILALHQRDFKTAEVDAKRSINLDPGFSEAWLALGSLYVMQKEMKPADEVFQKATVLASPWSGSEVRYAQFKILIGDPDSGQRLLQDAIKKNPAYFPAWMALAQLSAAENNFTNSIALLDNVLNRDPINFEALMLKGRLELQQGQIPQALASYQQMVKTYPEIPIARYALAQAYLANNQTNQAEDSLNQALNMDPDYADAILLRAETRIMHGDTAPAIVSLRQLIEQQPNVIQARVLLADAYCAQGSFNSALQIYRDLATSYLNSPQVPALLGKLYLQQHQKTEARDAFEKALRLQPDYLPAIEELVNLDLSEKQYTAALHRVQQLVVKNPNQAALQILLGSTFAAQGKANDAETALSKAIRLQPGSQAAYLMLARLYILNQQNQKALDDLQTALDKDPNDIAALMLMGIVYDSESDYGNARNAYEELLALAPANATALNNLACDYADHLDQLDKAYPLARQARDVAPKDPSIADTVGWILYRRKEYTAALVLLRESAAKLYAVPIAQYHLGMACYMAGYEMEAKTKLQQALQLAGGFPEKNECEQRLVILNTAPQQAGVDTRLWLEKWTVNHPEDSVALGQLASIYQLDGLSDKAIGTDQDILNVCPQNVTAMVSLAQLYAATDSQKAYAYAKSAYELAPNDPTVTYLSGRLAFLTGEYKWALTLLQLSARSQPQNPELLYDLGKAYYSVGNISAARTAIQNALQMGTAFTNTGDANHFLFLTALANDPSQALTAQSQIDKILKTTPGYVPALMAKAAIAEQRGDAATIQQSYQDVLKIYPDFAPAQKQLAILYAKNPDNDAMAYPLAMKAYEAFPHDIELAKTLGIIVCRQGDYARAINLLEVGLAQSNQDPQLLYYLGLAQYHLKQSQQSKATLQRALNLDLSGKDATDAKLILAELR